MDLQPVVERLDLCPAVEPRIILRKQLCSAFCTHAQRAVVTIIASAGSATATSSKRETRDESASKVHTGLTCAAGFDFTD